MNFGCQWSPPVRQSLSLMFLHLVWVEGSFLGPASASRGPAKRPGLEEQEVWTRGSAELEGPRSGGGGWSFGTQSQSTGGAGWGPNLTS